MVRFRLAAAVLAAGLGTAAGCCPMSDSCLVGRFRRCPADCTSCEAGGCDGPALGSYPAFPAQPGAGAVISPPMPQQEGMPPLSPPPRLVPQPQAQPTPYTPQKLGRAARSTRPFIPQIDD